MQQYLCVSGVGTGRRKDELTNCWKEVEDRKMILRGKTVGVFVAEGFEDLEFWVPVMRLREEGARTLIIGIAHGDSDRQALPDGYAGCPCLPDQLGRAGWTGDPGGWAPDKLRRDPDVLRLVRECHVVGKPIGVICHGGWVAASAGIVEACASLDRVE